MSRPKVFIIGLNKTCTSSLKIALGRLGYHVSPHSMTAVIDVLKRKNFDKVEQMLETYDAHQDLPWPLLWEQMYDRYPDARFVLSLRRSASAWVESLSKHMLYYSPRHAPAHRAAFGRAYVKSAPDVFYQIYERHNAAVRNFFAQRGHLLEMAVDQGEGWDVLCPFLDLPTPDEPFPHENAAKKPNSARRKLVCTVNRVLDRVDRCRPPSVFEESLYQKYVETPTAAHSQTIPTQIGATPKSGPDK